MRKPKVLLVSCEGLGNGGVQSVMMNIVRQLTEKYDFDVLLFTSEKRFYDDEFLKFGGKIIRIPHYEGLSEIRNRIDYYVRGVSLYRKIRSVLRNDGPYDVIHCNNVFESGLCLMAAKKEGIPVRIVHSHTAPEQPNIIARMINYIYQKMINANATYLVGCSIEACEFLYGKHQNFFVLPNPYNENYYDKKKYPKILSQFSLEVTQVGRFDENKNQLFSVKVVHELKKKYADVHLNLVGFGNNSYIKILKNRIKEMNLLDNISFFDGCAEIPRILRHSHVFLLPSKKEGFGIVLIEAQAMGLTCFVSDSVPKTTNLGGCVYMSLMDGPEMWAQCIASKMPFIDGDFDCSAFSLKKFADSVDAMYGKK